MERIASSWPPWVASHWKGQGMGLVLFAFFTFYPIVFHVQEYLFFVFLFSAIGVTLYQGNSIWVRSPLDLPLAMLVGWILITVPFSIDPAYSFAEWRKLVAHILVFYWTLLVLKNYTGTDYWRYVIGAMLVGVSTMSLYAIVVFFQEGGGLLSRSVRATVPASAIIWLGAYVVMMVPVVIACYVWSKNHLEKFAMGVVLCLLLLAEFFSYARGGWVALAAMGIGFGILRGSKKIFAWGALLVVLIVSVLFGISQFGYLGGVFDPLTLVDRIACWLPGVQATLENPLVGVGFGQETFGQLPAHMYGECKPHIREISVHNTYIMYAMGSGVPALIFLLWTFGVVITKFSRDAMIGRSTEVKSFKIAVALMALGYGVTMITANQFSKELAYLLWMLVAAGMSLPHEPATKD